MLTRWVEWVAFDNSELNRPEAVLLMCQINLLKQIREQIGSN